MRATGLAALAFWVLLGMPGALFYGAIALVVSASVAIAAAIATSLFVPMPFVGALCVASGLASDAEGL